MIRRGAMSIKKSLRTFLAVSICLLAATSVAHAQYSGGTGEPNDPYQIATAADLITLGETPDDYDKHFILIADIDLDPNLPGGRVFDRAVIAPDTDPDDRNSLFQGTTFAGVFDGDGHTILHLEIEAEDFLGLFGELRGNAVVCDLNLEATNIKGAGLFVGGLVGRNRGNITTSYSTGTVTGDQKVGGLVGINYGSIATIATSYSTGTVTGDQEVGGLVGANYGSIATSYSSGAVTGIRDVGGFVGHGRVGRTLHCVWDMETSGPSRSAGGVGLTTAEMMDLYMIGVNGFAEDPNWVLNAGLDYPRLAWEGTAGQTIPVPEIDWLDGQGTPEVPYRIDTADQLILLTRAGGLWDEHFILGADIDLDPNLQGREVFSEAVIQVFSGVFDGNDHTISNLTIEGDHISGLFGRLAGEVRDLGVVDIKISGSGEYVGGLVGRNDGGHITNCHSTGTISGDAYIGGLVGGNSGNIIACYSPDAVGVNGNHNIGGLTGSNGGDITQCFSAAFVSGVSEIGGLSGSNHGGATISRCYAICTVLADDTAGGLVGANVGYTQYRAAAGTLHVAIVSDCYSIVLGGSHVSGLLVGENGRETTLSILGNYPSLIKNCYASCESSEMLTPVALIGRSRGLDTFVMNCFWDAECSGIMDNTEGGTPETTVEMQTASTFLEAGWDFVDETANGPNDVWKIVEGQTYPLLSWQKYAGGTGEPNDPYLIYTAEHLNALGAEPNDYDKHFKLMADIDLSGYEYDRAVIAPDMNDMEEGYQGIAFRGHFHGNGHKISHLTIRGDSVLGFFGQLGSEGQILGLGLEAVDVNGTGDYVGGLVGENGFAGITNCYSSGKVSGEWWVGGLVGYSNTNGGSITTCYSTCTVSGESCVGGLVGLVDYNNDGSITMSHSTGTVSGDRSVGGLVGTNWGSIAMSHSTGTVSGDLTVGGLVGYHSWTGSVANCYSNGAITGTERVGGLVGGSTGSITNCFSSGTVTGTDYVGGLVGSDRGFVPPAGRLYISIITASFWDIETSGLTNMCGDADDPQGSCDDSYGKTTAEMQTATTFLESGWDFIGETENGPNDIWWILEGQDYPRLWWELIDEAPEP